MQTDSIDGVKIKLFEKKDSPIYIRVIFQAGSRYDQKEGTAHFLEHVLCAGSEKFPSKDLLSEYLENVGGQFGLFTTTEGIYLNIQIAEAADLSKATEVLDQMINHPIFSTDIVEKERGSIFAEQDIKKTNQKDFVYVVNQRLMFQETSLQKTVLGTKETVTDITIEDLVKFKNQNLTKEKMSIIVSGDIGMENLKKDLVSILPISGEKFPCPSEKLPVVRNKKSEFEVYNSNQVSLIASFRLKDFGLKDKVCADICSDYLGGSRSSLLIKELRYKRGLVYSVFVQNKFFSDYAFITIKTDCPVDKFSEVLVVTKDTLNDFYFNSLTEEKLSFIKTKLEKSLKIKMQTSMSWVEQNEQFNISDYVNELQKISKDDIQSFIKNNLNPEELYLAVCGPENVKEFVD